MCEASSVSPGFCWNRAVQRRQLVAIPRHHVDDDLDVLRVHLGQDGLGIALEDVRIELERGLRAVPAARREAGAEIDHRVDRNLLRPEGVDDPEDLRFVLERAVRLHVTERPLRRHRRRSGDRGKVLERFERIAGVEHEEVEQARHDLVDRRPALHRVLLLVALRLRTGVGRPAAATVERRRASRRGDRPAPRATRRTGPSRRCRTASRRDCVSRTCRSASAAPSCRACRADRTARAADATACPASGRGPPSPRPSTG